MKKIKNILLLFIFMLGLVIITSCNKNNIDNDIVETFIDEYDLRPSETEMRPLSEVFRMFNAWTKDNNYRPLSNRTFANRLRGLKFRTKKVGTTQVFMESDSDLPI